MEEREGRRGMRGWRGRERHRERERERAEEREKGSEKGRERKVERVRREEGGGKEKKHTNITQVLAIACLSLKKSCANWVVT